MQATDSSPTVRLPFIRHFLVRGESVVASLGIVTVALVALSLTVAGGWAVWSHRHALVETRVNGIRSATALIATAAEPILAAGESTSLRRLVSESARANGLTACRLTLPDGRVIASAEAHEITAGPLPASWSGTLKEQAGEHRTGTRLVLVHEVNASGRGPALLEVTVDLVEPSLGGELLTGLAAIGAGSLLLSWLVYRWTRSKLRVMGAVREALLAMRQGEESDEALMLGPTMGPEAEAWNQMLAERQARRAEVVSQQTRQALDSRRRMVSDLEEGCDAMWQGLLLVDEQLQIRYANGAAAVFLKVPRDQITGMKLDAFLPDAKALESFRTVASGVLRRRTSVEIEPPAEGEGSVFRFTIRPVRKGDGAAAVVVVEDITQLRAAESARHSFVAQAAHELRTPLTNIRLNVETALDEGVSDTQLRGRCLNVINQEAYRLERIVAEMLSVAEIEAGSFKLVHDDVRLDALLADLERDYQAQAVEKGLTLVFDLPPKLPVLQGDRDKIMLAVQNLLGNALKYTPSGGRITVKVRVASNRLQIDVADTGFGIAPDDAQHLFEKFYRARDRRVARITGTGLGLALAREVVRLHGGDITFESELNQGSTFTIHLPVAAEAA